jgi:hypothetical protein
MTKPYHKNVAGPFYVEADCCLMCGIPVAGAPEVFVYDEDIRNGPCFVYRQPQTAEEFGKVIKVLKHQDIACIRYRGADPAELRQLSKHGLRNLCDNSHLPKQPWWKFWRQT